MPPRLILRLALIAAPLSAIVAGCGSDDSSSGCANDNECKGNRVCSGGQCVDPGAGGSGGSGGTSGGSCPSADGTWTVASHCESSLVGTTITISQNGCSFTDQDFGFTGTIGADGSFTSTGTPPGGDMLTCTGTVSGSTMSQTCTPGDCAVTLTR